ncbi:MAG TPA: hypothetical protein VM370_07605 [Candidatus Thermoplasmatota archaeon]|nr:hypothetical protein [Candidatus Thermoplasmatota archaeon]
MSSNTQTKAKASAEAEVATADDLIVARAELDFEEGLAHARARIKETHGFISGAALDALITGAVAALQVRTRMGKDVRELIDIARRAQNGANARSLCAAHLDHILRLKRGMHLVAREDDPEFLHIRERCLDIFEARLPDLAKMAAVTDATDYSDLVRKAFPERAHVDAIVEDNAARVAAILDHLEKHPHVLRMPQSMAPKLARTSREFLAWKVADVKRGVDEIYRARTS